MKTQILEPDKKQVGFWKRQFQTEATKKQKIFDWIFGVILPVVCCYFDPHVFKTTMWGMNGAILGEIKPFAYILSFVSIMMLLMFLLWGEKLKWFNGFLCGLFSIGALISLSVGILLFPFSLLGLIILIGALGFTPLFASFVYFRNAIRAYEFSLPILSKSVLINSLILSAILSFVLPYLINLKIQHGLEIMINGDVDTIRAMTQKFKYIAPIVNFEPLARKHSYISLTAEQKEALAESYKELTGEDIVEMKRLISD